MIEHWGYNDVQIYSHININWMVQHIRFKRKSINIRSLPFLFYIIDIVIGIVLITDTIQIILPSSLTSFLNTNNILFLSSLIQTNLLKLYFITTALLGSLFLKKIINFFLFTSNFCTLTLLKEIAIVYCKFSCSMPCLLLI